MTFVDAYHNVGACIAGKSGDALDLDIAGGDEEDDASEGERVDVCGQLVAAAMRRDVLHQQVSHVTPFPEQQTVLEKRAQ